MKYSIAFAASFLLLTVASAPAFATVIDFEAQAANAGGNLTGIPDSPLTIGIATFTAGELRQGLIGLPADQTGVYATQGLFGSGETNPLVITFSTPVSGFSLLLANGDAQNQSYTVSDNVGDSTMITLALPGSVNNPAATVSLAGSGITSVSIASANAVFWDFAIDNVTFTEGNAVPEPASGFLLLMGLGLALCYKPQNTWRYFSKSIRKFSSSPAETSDTAQ